MGGNELRPGLEVGVDARDGGELGQVHGESEKRTTFLISVCCLSMELCNQYNGTHALVQQFLGVFCNGFSRNATVRPLVFKNLAPLQRYIFDHNLD